MQQKAFFLYETLFILGINANFARRKSFEININYSNRKIMSEIEAKVKAIIVDKLSVDEADVKNEASFANDLGADSLGDAIAYIEANK